MTLGRQHSLTEEAPQTVCFAPIEPCIWRATPLGYATLVADAPGGRPRRQRSSLARWWRRDWWAIRVAPTGRARSGRGSPRDPRRPHDRRRSRAGFSGPIRPTCTMPGCENSPPAADPTTRTFLARYAITDADPRIRLGMTASPDARRGRQANASHGCPLPRCFDHGMGPSVWVVGEAGKLTERPVRVSRYEGFRRAAWRGCRRGWTASCASAFRSSTQPSGSASSSMLSVPDRRQTMMAFNLSAWCVRHPHPRDLPDDRRPAQRRWLHSCRWGVPRIPTLRSRSPSSPPHGPAQTAKDMQEQVADRNREKAAGRFPPSRRS